MWPWLRKNYSKLQFALRMTLAALLSYGLGEALGLAQTYWAALSAVIVIQGSVGGSLRAGINRFFGTLGGAAWGAVIAVAIVHNNATTLAIALLAAIAPLGLLTAFRPDFRVAPPTAIIVLMSGSLQTADPLLSALSRVLEITLGSAVAIVVALFVLPAHAHGLLARAAASALSTMADLVLLLKAAPSTGLTADGLSRVQSRMRSEIAQAEARAEEATLERANRLSDGPDPEPLSRTLRRLRHDLAILTRALRNPFSKGLQGHFEAPLSKLFDALGEVLAQTSKALTAGGPPPELDKMRAAVEEYKAAAEHHGMTFGASSDDAQRIFVLLFLFDQMLKNLEDLGDRTREVLSARRQAQGMPWE
ncbi:MAG TPA: FUSC family protein [Hyphomicrobiales bacterium]|nr:FUSC family protein [Hyphomicrobiales bacterium]